MTIRRYILLNPGEEIVVEADQFTTNNRTELATWCNGSVRGAGTIRFDTPDDPEEAHLGDYIVKGEHSEFYAINPLEFHDYYQLKED